MDVAPHRGLGVLHPALLQQLVDHQGSPIPPPARSRQRIVEVGRQGGAASRNQRKFQHGAALATKRLSQVARHPRRRSANRARRSEPRQSSGSWSWSWSWGHDSTSVGVVWLLQVQHTASRVRLESARRSPEGPSSLPPVGRQRLQNLFPAARSDELFDLTKTLPLPIKEILETSDFLNHPALVTMMHSAASGVVWAGGDWASRATARTSTPPLAASYVDRSGRIPHGRRLRRFGRAAFGWALPLDQGPQSERMHQPGRFTTRAPGRNCSGFVRSGAVNGSQRSGAGGKAPRPTYITPQRRVSGGVGNTGAAVAPLSR